MALPPSGPPVGWLPAAFNNGWSYQDRVPAGQSGEWLSVWMARRYRHSSGELWRQRMEAGQLQRNSEPLRVDVRLAGGELITWERPPWQEDAIPGSWDVIQDDGDFLVINKPAGLPVQPGGGFLMHTLTSLLEQRSRAAGEPLPPRPVHRLGRFTSGLQVCARTVERRASLTRQFRPEGSCRKVYQAWAHRIPGLEINRPIVVNSDVVERPHPLLGWIWGPEPLQEEPIRRRLSAHSELRLLERSAAGDRLQVTIRTGRPHQIRIHLAQLGCPLLGDPLYLLHREISATATPGDGGYRLHAWRLDGPGLRLCCPMAESSQDRAVLKWPDG